MIAQSVDAGSVPSQKRIERLLVAVTLFYSAAVFCFPVTTSETIAALYPWWAKRIVVGNAQLYEFTFLAWLGLYGARFVPRVLLNGGIPTRQAALWLIALALWCGVMSLGAPLVWLDLGRTIRLVLNAALLVAAVRWTRQTNEFPLAMLILGFLAGTVINLYFSFRYPLVVFETMRLSGQNTPGVAMGIAIHLCAWLFFRTHRLHWRALALIATGVFAFGCGISYSRIGWFTGGLGLMAWFYVLVLMRPRDRSERRRMKRLRLVLVPVLVVALGGFFTSPLGRQGVEWVGRLVEQKLTNETGDSDRFAYVIGTADILARYPLGVGYSGFYEAMTTTAIYRSGRAVREPSASEANPHAGILWYTTTGGIPGGLLVVLVLGLLLNSLRFGLVSAMGRPGLVLAALITLPFVLISLTVPYILNSMILIVPAAIAAGWGWARRIELASGAPPTIDHSHAKKTLRSAQPSPSVP